MSDAPSSFAPRRSAVRRASRRRRSGFTLIEVLGTLLLLGIVIPAAMEAMSVALATSGAVRHRTEAAVLAESQLTDLVVTGEWQDGLLSGDFPPDQLGYTAADWPNFRWEASAAAWDQGNSGVQELIVKVSWTRNSIEESITASTLVYVSAASQTVGGAAP